jgi:hypothetical protein
VTVTAEVNGRGSGAGVGPSPAGVRLSRRRWRDPRLIIGIVLIAASAVGVAWVVAAADDRVGVWVVSGGVPAGSPVSHTNVTVAEVQVPDLDTYWSSSDPIPPGLVATRDFADGELLTQAGVTTPDASSIRIVTLPVLRNQMPSDLDVGRRVDVYVVERGASGAADGPPQLVLRNAIVSSVDGDSGTFGGTSLEVGVALSLPDEQVAKVLDAQARGSLTLVDVPVASP